MVGMEGWGGAGWGLGWGRLGRHRRAVRRRAPRVRQRRRRKRRRGAGGGGGDTPPPPWSVPEAPLCRPPSRSACFDSETPISAGGGGIAGARPADFPGRQARAVPSHGHRSGQPNPAPPPPPGPPSGTSPVPNLPAGAARLRVTARGPASPVARDRLVAGPISFIRSGACPDSDTARRVFRARRRQKGGSGIMINAGRFEFKLRVRWPVCELASSEILSGVGPGERPHPSHYPGWGLTAVSHPGLPSDLEPKIRVYTVNRALPATRSLRIFPNGAADSGAVAANTVSAPPRPARSGGGVGRV
jgi:hypothetical protein